MMRKPSWLTRAPLAALAMLIVVLVSVSVASAQPWKFGVMGDTQWTCNDPTGQNPNTVPISIINQINQQFIAQGVKFVVEVGDLTDNGTDVAEITRAQAAQPLYNAGIGFFPFRGNHETYAAEYGLPNNYGLPVFQSNYPQTRGLSNTFGARNFSSPTSVSPDLNGMSYSFDYGDLLDSARFVILDSWVTPSKDISAAGYDYGYSFGDQQNWINNRLTRNLLGPRHLFVFSHQPLMAENHQDCPFVGYTNANPDVQNAFYASLQKNGVGYYISGHDHINQRSIIASPDGLSKVQELICASNSSKFYTPKVLNDSNWFGQKVRETSVSQETYHVGYYIFTVDGPRVTVDYYSDDHTDPTLWMSDASYPAGNNPAFSLNVTPTFTFIKKATWGYSLNGQEFLVPEGASYTSVQDSFAGTDAKILAGTNGSTAMDYTGRAFTKTVDTGWTLKLDLFCSDFASDVLTLWGMKDCGAAQTDTYVLSLSYDEWNAGVRQIAKGKFGISTRNASGKWINAVDANAGGAKQFVLGPWNSSYGLGTYGVDAKTRTAWAVINHDGDFAVTGGL